MRATLIKTTGEKVEILPEDGELFNLGELSRITQGWLTFKDIGERVMAYNSEGRAPNKAKLDKNPAASFLHPEEIDIFGDVLIADRSLIYRENK
jgi:hypothetical protein